MLSQKRLRYIGSTILKDLSVRIGRNKSKILPMVVSVAASEWKKSGGYVDYDEVVAEALLGLVKADVAFKKRGVKFSTYAYIRVAGAAKDVIRREISNNKKHVLVDSEVLSRVKLLQHSVCGRRCVVGFCTEQRLISGTWRGLATLVVGMAPQ